MAETTERLFREGFRQCQIELADSHRPQHVLWQFKVGMTLDDETEVEHDIFDALAHTVHAQTRGVGEAVHIHVDFEVPIAAPENGARADQKGSTVVPVREGKVQIASATNAIRQSWSHAIFLY